MRCEFHRDRNGKPTCRSLPEGWFRIEHLEDPQGKFGPPRIELLCLSHVAWYARTMHRLYHVTRLGKNGEIALPFLDSLHGERR